jgi:sec-independent protein translocase protein TatA
MGLENPLHIAILLVILLLLFGAKRLPEMGRGLGAGIRSFKDGISGRIDAEDSEAAKQAEPATVATPALPAAEAPVAVPPLAVPPLAEPPLAEPPLAEPPAAGTAPGSDAEPVGHPS